MGRFLISEAAGESFPLARADGGAIPCQPATGSGAAGSLVLIFPTIDDGATSLEAYNASSPQVLQQGQLAVVQSNNSLWELSPGVEGEVDNITVASVTAPPFANAVWTRTNVSLALPTYLRQTAWHVNRNTGDDEAAGNTALLALKTKAELYRRLGYTWNPDVSTQNVVISVDAPDTDGTDPWLFEPNFINGGNWTLQAPLPAPSFTGTLNVVTAKNHATNTPLSTTVTTTTGALAAGSFMVNATRGGSVAFVAESLGGGAFQLSQPLMPSTPPASPVTTEVDTWAHGDAITAYTLQAVDVARLGGEGATLDSSFDMSMSLFQLTVFDPSGFGLDTMQVPGTCATGIAHCALGRSPFMAEGVNPLTIQAASVFCLSATMVVAQNAGDPSGTSLAWAGGVLATSGTHIGQVALSNDVILGGSGPTLVNCTLGAVFYQGAVVVQVDGSTKVSGAQYGTGTLNNDNGVVDYSAVGGGTPAQTAFPLTGGLQIHGNTSAYSNVTTAGSTATHLVTLTPAHLDAAAGAAGFGGMAYVPSVGGFTNGAVTP